MIIGPVRFIVDHLLDFVYLKRRDNNMICFIAGYAIGMTVGIVMSILVLKYMWL